VIQSSGVAAAMEPNVGIEPPLPPCQSSNLASSAREYDSKLRIQPLKVIVKPARS